MEENKKFCGIYSFKKYFDAYFNDRIKALYSIWIAQYNTKCMYRGTYKMWQKTARGNVNGIYGNVNLDICYYDFPSLIKRAHLNGF